MLRLIIASLLILTFASPGWAQEAGSATQADAVAADPSDDDFFFDDDDDEAVEERGEPAQRDDEGTQEAGAQTTSEAEIDEEEDIKKSFGIEEIMVTSQRRRSTLQDVPVSVTAFSASEIEAQGIQDIKGIAQYTPNLEIKTAFAASNPTLFIRGVGLNDYNANAASSVAVYMDQVYMNSPAGQLFQFFDVQNVEVLRGPQGSLYGRNASAGAIRITSNEPTEDFDLTGTVTYGRFNEAEVESAIGGTIVDGLVTGRAAFHYRRRDGYVKNHCVFEEGLTHPQGDTFPYEAGWCDPGGPDNEGATRFDPPDGILDSVSWRSRQTIPAGLPARLNDVNNWAARAMVRVTPDLWEMDWLFNIHGGQNLSQTTALFHAGNKLLGGVFRDRQGYPAVGGNGNTNPWAGHYNRVGYEFLDTLGASARGKIEIGEDATFHTLSAYESAERHVTDDFDSAPGAVSHNDTNDLSWQFSENLRLDWQASDELGMTFGAEYLMANLKVDNEFRVNGSRNRRPQFATLNNPGRRLFQDYEQRTYAMGLFGHFHWSFLDDFTLEGGLRYSWERKTFDISSFSKRPPQACPQANQTICDGGNPDGSDDPWLADRGTFDGVDEVRSRTWSAPTGDISLGYRLTEDATVYGKYSRGWKPGGFNGLVTLAGENCKEGSCPITEPIEAESVDGFELGLKSYWFDRRLMFNASMFFQKYNDLQVFVLENVGFVGIPLPKLINAADAEIYGLEAEIHARPIPGLNIRSAFGWLESKYLDFTRNFFRQSTPRPPSPPIIRVVKSDFTGNRLGSNPRFSWSGVVSYEIAIGEESGYITPRFDWAYKSLTYFDVTEGKDRNGRAVYRDNWEGNTFLGQPAYWVLGAGVGYTTPDERLEVSLWVRNLTNKAYSIDAFSFLETNESVLRVIGEPRTFGITVWMQY